MVYNPLFSSLEPFLAISLGSSLKLLSGFDHLLDVLADHLVHAPHAHLCSLALEYVLLLALDIQAELLSEYLIKEVEEKGSLYLAAYLVAPQCLSEIDQALLPGYCLDLRPLRSLLNSST